MIDVTRFGSASVSQVSELIGRTEDQVVAEAVQRAGTDAAVRGWLTPEAVAALLVDIKPTKPLDEAKDLIMKAFQQAHESGKSDWASMAIPVLKNRLLQASGQSFKEKEYGSPNIWHFVTQFPDVLRVSGARPYERVQLIDPSVIDLELLTTPAALDMAGRGRIRPDLWRALFDYSSENTYVWDESIGRARVARDGDSSPLIIPTLTNKDLETQRQEFVQTLASNSENDRERLQGWVHGSGATVALPRAYRTLWNAHLKGHAANHLRAFFIQHNLTVPADLLTPVSTDSEPEPYAEKMRTIAHRYIDAMTSEELGRLSFELAVTTRISLNV